MRGRWTVVALTLGMGALPAFVSAQGHAVPRGGESSGSSSSGGTAHGSSSGSSSGSSGGSSSASSGSQSSGPSSDAERRHPRPGTGTGDRFAGRNSYYYGSPFYYGRNYYYDTFDPFYYGAYGYSPFYYSGSYGYAPYYYRGRYRDSGSMRVIVDPDQTRVYVDGYYAGIADDFDGLLQRLSVPPGRHEITLKLDGYRTHRFRVYVPIGETIKIHHVMERGNGEDTDEVIGEEPYRREERNAPPPYDDRDGRRPDARDRDDRRDHDEIDRRERDDPGEDDRDDADAATVRLDLRPPDASVYVDGEFRGSGRRVETLRLAPGRHRLEVVRPGYRTVEREIDARPGEETRVQIDLGR
jgi:PEGA domain-containing protein